MKPIILKLWMLVTLLSTSFHMLAYDFGIDGIKYDITASGNVEAVSANNYVGSEMRIPETVTYGGNVYRVTSIGYVDYGFGMGSFELNRSVKSICIPKTVTRIRTYQEPASYGTYDLGFFYGCENLAEINVDSENPMYMSIDGVLFYKDLYSLLCYPKAKTNNKYKIPEGVEEIYASAFEDAKYIQKIEMPNSLKYIRNSSFASCNNLKEVTNWSTSLEILDTDAFEDTSLSEAILPSTLKEIGDDAFDNHSNPTTMTIYSKCIKPASIKRYKGDEQPFNEKTLEYGILYVPKGSLKYYQRAECWSDFKWIEEYDFTSLNEITSSSDTIHISIRNHVIYISDKQPNSLVEVYNLEGTLVTKTTDDEIANLSSGIYVLKVGGQVFKAIL